MWQITLPTQQKGRISDKIEGLSYSTKLIDVHSQKLRPGGSNSRNDPGVWLSYSDSTRRAEHAHIGGTSQRVANSGVRALWS